MGQITKNVRSRDQFKKYETETRSLRDQDRDRDRDPENWSRDLHHCITDYVIVNIQYNLVKHNLNKRNLV